MHYMRWWKHGDPSITFASHRFVGDAVTYSGAHIRVRNARGPASAQVCECGQPAGHWSYDHSDPDEKHDERGRPYSPDPSHYRPMCVPCHKRADLEIKPPALVRDARGCYRSAS
jgi:hypothetical protein